MLASSTSLAVGSDQACLLVPSYQQSVARGLVIWCHAYGESAADDFVRDGRSRPIVSALLGAGYMVAGSLASGPNWGNQAGLDAYGALEASVRARGLTVTKSVLLGVSMGGLPALLSYAVNEIPNLIGVLGVCPVCNLGDMWTRGVYTESIRGAFGIAENGSDYAAKTSGYDPALLAGATWNGKRLRFYASADDAVAPKAEHSDAIDALATGAAESTVVACSGAHGDTDQFRASDVLATVNAWMAA